MNKTMENKIITRDVVFEVRKPSQEMIDNREREFVISSESVDTYETVFVSEGADFTRYDTNPIVAYNHRTWSGDPDMIIATSKVYQENKLTIGRAKFEDFETNPTADKILKKVDAGTLRMASIGANVKEWRYGDAQKGENPGVIYFTKWELLEWSIVPIGSNKDALARNVQIIEEIRTELRAKDIEVVTEEETASTAKLSVREAKYKFNKNNSF